ncbi:MAG: Azurin [Acidobacteria bacterium]|nr:Azurin [Acidobacteriota bacterium]
MNRFLFPIVSFSVTLWAGDPLIIQANDLMQFQPNEIQCKSGEELVVVLKNVSRIPNFSHNWVLLKAGTNVNDFGNEAITAASTGYIPTKMKDRIIAFIPLTEPGKENRVTFVAPEVGSYVFLCSYPGRYSVMQGVLIVK